ncbi:MAG: hypothetical protein JEZ08_10790 [Clostridiales bacterium]|nr:hypothetical protein [Clostridiales bacterium]
MNKNYKMNKHINYVHKGYVLYDTDLKTDYFVESLNAIINLHDIFHHTLKDNNLVEQKNDYIFNEIHCLDQIGLSDAIDNVKEIPLTNPAEFKLIYFHGNLRGYQYRFNGFLFDQRSVKKVIEGIEKQYFKGKTRQSSTSYKKWLTENNKSFSMAFKTGQYQGKTKLLTLDENLTKRVRQHLKDKDLSLFQFITGIIGIYYKVSKQKDLMFMTDYFEDQSFNLIGDTTSKTSYMLKKNPNLTCNDFIKNDWIEKNKFSHIKINMRDRCKELKGDVYTLQSPDMPYEMGFMINEMDWEIELEITFQKYRTKKDELFLMLNKLRMIIFDVLENETKVSNLSLLTKKEEEIALKYIEPKVMPHYCSVYDQFKAVVLKSPQDIAVIDTKPVTFEKLDHLVEKIKKSLEKSNVTKQSVDLTQLTEIEKIAAFFAIDGVEAVYSDKGNYQLKKGLFGYKASKLIQGKILNAQYNLDDTVITREGYINHCNFISKYFDLTEKDIVSHLDLIKFGVPTLLKGGKIHINSTLEDVTLAEVPVNDLKEFTNMRHVITNDKVVRESYDYKLHYGISIDQTTPLTFIGPIEGGRLENLAPCDGIGFVILNKYQELAQTFEKGNIYLFGPGVTTCFDIETLNVKGHELHHVVKSSQRGTWFLDESLRL